MLLHNGLAPILQKEKKTRSAFQILQEVCFFGLSEIGRNRDGSLFSYLSRHLPAGNFILIFVNSLMWPYCTREDKGVAPSKKLLTFVKWSPEVEWFIRHTRWDNKARLYVLKTQKLSNANLLYLAVWLLFRTSGQPAKRCVDSTALYSSNTNNRLCFVTSETLSHVCWRRWVCYNLRAYVCHRASSSENLQLSLCYSMM